jgi:hypothetical protein
MGRSKCGGSHFFPDPFQRDLDSDGIFGETGAAAPSGDEVGWTPTFYAVDGPGSQEVRLLVYDTNGLHDSASAVVNVTADTNGPTVALSGLDSVAEGGSVALAASHSGGWSGEVSYAWSLRFDGMYGNDSDETGDSVTLNYDWPSTYSVSVFATDPAGHRARAFKSIQVINVPPTPNPGGPYTVAQGASVPLSASATDPGGPNDIAAYAWDLDGDGIFGETGLASAPCGNEVGANPTFWAADAPDVNGKTVVWLRVTDAFGDAGYAAAEVTVTSNADSPTVDVVWPTSINEGDSAILTSVASSSGWSEAPSYVWDLDGDGIYGENSGETGSPVTFSAGSSTAGQLLGVLATDTAGHRSRSSAWVEINNVAPTVAAPASAGTNPVTTTHTTLSVLGADAAGESDLS